MDDDPREFWTEDSTLKKFLILSQFAMDLFAIPGSSAPVERVFSTAGRRHRLSGEHLEQRVLMRKNSDV